MTTEALYKAYLLRAAIRFAVNEDDCTFKLYGSDLRAVCKTLLGDDCLAKVVLCDSFDDLVLTLNDEPLRLTVTTDSDSGLKQAEYSKASEWIIDCLQASDAVKCRFDEFTLDYWDPGTFTLLLESYDAKTRKQIIKKYSVSMQGTSLLLRSPEYVHELIDELHEYDKRS